MSKVLVGRELLERILKIQEKCSPVIELRKCQDRLRAVIDRSEDEDSLLKDAERYRAFRKAGLPNGLGVYDAELDAACDELIEEQLEDA